MAESGDMIYWAKIKITRLKTKMKPEESKELTKVYCKGQENDLPFIARCALQACMIPRTSIDFRHLEGIEKQFKIEVIELLKETSRII